MARAFIFILLVHVVTFCCVAVIGFSVDERKVDTIVGTKCGSVRGKKSDEVYVFKGIPYALPPTKQLRWKPPVPLSQSSQTCWTGVYNATEFSSPCFQPIVGKFSAYQGSEDCLYSNVWTPTLDQNAKLPVLIWIHGGSLIFYSGSYSLYSPTETLVRETNVVYVSMNYRLNAFGFMALDLLSAESDTKTSRSIVIKITLYGQSSGGSSIVALLASPLAKGMFEKAWIMSASPVLNKTLADASRDNLAFLNNTNCTDVACLRQMTPAQVLLVIPWFEYPYWAMGDLMNLPQKNYFVGALAIVDGVVVTSPPFDAWEKGEGSDRPVIIGSIAQETDVSPIASNINNWSWADYTYQIQNKLGTFGSDIVTKALALYPVNSSVTPEYQYTSMVSDLRVNCPNDVLAAEATGSFKSNVYRYVVTSSPSVAFHPFGGSHLSKYAFHMWDFIAFSGFIPSYIESPTSSDIEFQETLRREILSFVRSSEMNSTLWIPFPAATAVLSDSMQIVSGCFNADMCKFWTKNNFFSYA